MSNPKRHHTIPRVYLDNFKDGDGRLTVYSKRQKKALRPEPKDALIRSYYYSQPVDGVEHADHTMEITLLGGIETNYNRLYCTLIEQDADVDLELMFKTLLMLRARSPAFREAFELGLSDMVDKFSKSLPVSDFPDPPPGFPDLLEKLVISIDPHRSMSAMAHYVRFYAQAIISCCYSVRRLPKGSELITSDNPVIWYETRQPFSKERVYLNEATPRTRVVLPLNKSHVLLGRKRQLNEPPFKRGIRTLEKRILNEINELQIGCAWDHFIGNAKLPKQRFEYYSCRAPLLHIPKYNPDNNSFELDHISLGPIRKKHKFSRKE